MTVCFPELGACGRLGNQLYQLAATIGIAHARDDQPRFPPWDYQPYFNIPADYFGDCDDATNAADLATHIDERARPYLQDHNLFAEIMPTIRRILAPSQRARAMLDGFTGFHHLERPILGIHVRRGDNVPGADPFPNKHEYHPLPSLDYYKHATALAEPHASVAVFSDDPEWCEHHLDADYFHHGIPRPKEHAPGYHEPPLDWIDWHLLATCDNHVLSNSTFGMFAALVAGTDAIVPWPIYGPALDYIDATLLWPRTWTVVAC